MEACLENPSLSVSLSLSLCLLHHILCFCSLHFLAAAGAARVGGRGGRGEGEEGVDQAVGPLQSPGSLRGVEAAVGKETDHS